MRLAIVDGISYQRIGDDEYYAQELFQEEELTGYLKDMVEAEKSVYDYVVCDSDTEKLFAEKLEGAEDVKLYAKLPAWFKIDTPLGSYNPDWAVLIDKDDGQGEQLYFVVETKSSIFSDDIRASEQAKINCGIEHFKALSKDVNGEELDNPAKFVKADNYDTFSTHL
ncbi:restriction endonuclease [Pseudoalteromonas sp. H71]|uniref:restriction endonuclease n=1 Tax=Pseudoalteromonas sp. H71 TaxID=1348395 RepID=UPI002E132F50